jgi:mediator of RNA polymerase II transcription subunit 16
MDCLFNLLDEPGFTSILSNQRQFADLTKYLQAKNNVALHLILCSSTRGLVQAACRRLIHLDTLSSRAMSFYEAKAAAQNANDPAGAANRAYPALYVAYQKMQRFTSTSLVSANDIDKLLTTLSQEIRQAYQTSLPGLTRHQQMAQAAGKDPNSTNNNSTNNPSSQHAPNAASDPAIKRAQMHCELSIFLGTSPPPSFQPVLHNFFDKHLRAYRAQTDPARLFFADHSLLEVEDDASSLARRRAGDRYLDAFTRWELHASDRLGKDAGGGGGGAAAAAAPGIAGGAEKEEVTVENLDAQWRRCVRCAAVMENVYGSRPGFTFVLGQQRKCACGGSWGLLHKGAMVG